MNLGKFKKVHESEDHAILEHPEGHQITVAKRMISPKLKKDLASLPMCSGGDVQKFKDGGEALKVDQNTDFSNLQNKHTDWDALNRQDQANNQFTGDLTLSNPAPVPVPPVQSPLQAQPDPSMQAAPAAPQANNDPMGYQAEGAMYNKAMNMGLAGAQGEANARAELGEQQAAIMGDQAQALQDSHAHFMKLADDTNKHIDATTQDMLNNKINPKHYQESMSTGQKIGSAIALIMGGIGGGLAKQGNPALDYMNNQINRDIESQKMNMDKQKTLLGAYQQQFGNAQVAEEMTRLTLANLNMAKLKQAEGLAQTPLEKARLQQAQSDIFKTYAPLKQQMDSKLYMQQHSGGQDNMDPAHKIGLLELTGRMSPKDVESARKELSAAEEAEKLRADFQDSFNDLRSRSLNGALNPAARDSDLWTLAGKAVHLSAGRFNLEDAHKVLSGTMPGLGDVGRSGNYDLKQKKMDQFMDSLYTTPTLDQFDIKVPRGQASQGGGVRDGATASNSKGQRIIMKTGQWVPLGK